MKDNIRSAAVAGLFYPSDPHELRQMVTNLLADVAEPSPPAKAMITPHAGLIYSGPVAASLYAGLREKHATITRVIVMGPSHRVYLRGLALSTASYFETPLGTVKVDQDICATLQNLPQVCVSDVAHAEEHCLEMQLPFLQCVLDHVQIIPIVAGEATPEEVAEVLDRVWGDTQTHIIISSDLSHYHDYAAAQQLDLSTSQAIENLQADTITPQQACGAIPISGLLTLARRKSLKVARRDLRNSGDTAGSKTQVVGYGAYTFD